MLTLAWVEHQIEEAKHGLNEPQNVRDFALLCIARDFLKAEPTAHAGLYDAVSVDLLPIYTPTMMDKETAEKWVNNMRNEDKNHPHGGKWTPEALKPFAQKYNIPVDSPKFWEFYAMTNAMYSDYSEVVKKFGISSPEFYACMAKAFMDDRDAEPDKVARYYEYIAKK